VAEHGHDRAASRGQRPRPGGVTRAEATILGRLVAAELLARLVDEHPALELWAPPGTGVVNWRPSGRDPAEVRERLSDAWVSLADIAGARWFRSVAANPLADPHHVIDRIAAAL